MPRIVLVLSLVLLLANRVKAADTTPELSGFDALEPSCGDGGNDLALGEAGETATIEDSGFYMSGIVGASFGTLTQPDLPDSNAILNQTLFTAGGAAGWAFARPNGAWRAEFEGRGRERMQFTEIDPLAGTTSLHANDGWSAMANLWRDLELSDRAGIYCGGGIGAGGYRTVFSGTTLGAAVSGSTGITSFAWQAGGGASYTLGERVVLDLGYRFFSLTPGSADIFVTTAGGTIADSVRTQFSASEVLFSIRIYEPFKRWR